MADYRTYLVERMTRVTDFRAKQFEWLGGLVVCCDESIDVLLQLLDGGEGGVVRIGSAGSKTMFLPD